jgi:uncharacterized protein
VINASKWCIVEHSVQNGLEMRKQMSVVLLVLTSFWLPHAVAVRLDSLYTTKVYVANKSTLARQVAVTQSLEKVLIKVSGNVKVASIAKVKQQLTQAEPYLQRFSYQAVEGGGYWLVTKFNPRAVKQLLVSAAQAVWGEQRPQLLTWMVIRQNPEPQLVFANTGSQIPRLLSQFANFRGLPIILPIFDQNAIDQVSVADILEVRVDTLMRNARRYTAPAILLITLTPGVIGPWQGEWLLLVDGERLHWQNQGDSLANTVQDGINNATDLLVARYAVLAVDGHASEVDVLISDVNNLADYARVTRYLAHLTAVKKVEVREVRAHAIQVRLYLNGDRHALAQAMKLHPLLTSTGIAAHTLNDHFLQLRLLHAA